MEVDSGGAAGAEPAAPAGSRASSRRPLRRPPDDRVPLRWCAVAQGRRGRVACCRCCAQPFQPGELRLARESDSRAGAGRWLHLHCIPGGLHAQDEVL
eukprot:1949110-Alexandrium_andersonii.AAC.1